VQAEWNGTDWPFQYVYAGNKLVAEYTNTTTQFIHRDHLGSTRLVTGVSESISDSTDYLPFGQEGTGAIATTHKFTGKERDPESGLDNFDFRYYSSSMGRFMKPDEPFGGWEQNDPQSFNLYSYVRNSPTVNVDPDGHDCVYFSGGGSPYVKRNDCFSDEDEGIYVDGSVDVKSFKYHDSPSSWSYSYTAYETGNLGVGTIGNARLPGPENRTEMDNGAMTPGFLGPGDLILFGPGRGLFEGGLETETRTVIGKMADLQAEGAVRQGERALADDLADLGSPKANWAQNSGKLREVMSEGKPIRDVSAGKPGSNTGFLRAERNLLQNHGWALRGGTWYPPGK
jgi:RHS repeat-associated protein